MKERPIIFSAPMVRAILDGRKTQTRRVVKPQSAILTDDLARGLGVQPPRHQNPAVIPCPYGKPGERLWVRETWQRNAGSGQPIIYRADHDQFIGGAGSVYKADPATGEWEIAVWRWRPSIYMPHLASRITLEITDVRVQRLQDISEGDARAEGITDGGCLNCGESEPCGCSDPSPDARDAFAWLWQSIYGSGSWVTDPWVWAITFKRIAP